MENNKKTISIFTIIGVIVTLIAAAGTVIYFLEKKKAHYHNEGGGGIKKYSRCCKACELYCGKIATGENRQIIYKGTPIKLLVDFSMESLQAKRKWQDKFKVMRRKKLQPGILYQAGLLF